MRRFGQYIGKYTVLECTISAFPHNIMVWKKEGRPINIHDDKYSVRIIFKVILYSYLILKKMNERITDS